MPPPEEDMLAVPEEIGAPETHAADRQPAESTARASEKTEELATSPPPDTDVLAHKQRFVAEPAPGERERPQEVARGEQA